MTGPIGVVGCGMLGTSIALAARRIGFEVRCSDASPEVLRRSTDLSGAVPSPGVGECARGAAVVFVAVPVPDIPAVVTEVLQADASVMVSDVGSVKAGICATVEATVPEHAARFVGGHPMGGSERSGPEAASASLLDGVVWVLTPSQRTSPESLSRVEGVVRSLGADPVRLTPEAHDHVVAVVSHLPQVASTALMNLAAREDQGRPLLGLAAGGFRDLTRLAASNPTLWAGILASNRTELLRALDSYVEELGRIRAMVDAERVDRLEEALRAAMRERLRLHAKPQVRAGMAVLQIPVPDRPGVLAELATALSERGVNIEDIEIVHALEGGKGAVHLTVSADTAEAAAQALAARSFEAMRIV